jgi:hypothetical protein
LEIPHLPEDDIGRRIIPQPWQLKGELVGCEKVVGVEKSEHFGLREPDAVISGGGHASVWLADEADGVAELFRHRSCGIGRTIIHDQDFDIRLILDEDAFDGFGEEFFPVEDGNHNADLVGSGQGFGMGSFPGKIDKAPQPGKRLFRFV